MKKVLALIIALMFAFAVTAAFAADAPKAAAPADKKAAPKAEEKKEAKAKKATVTGEVLAIDAKAGTLTVKGPKKGDVALTTNDKTTVMAGKDKKTLADIKAGDKVAVAYTEADGKNTANKIDIKAAAKKAEEKKAPKAEEKKPAAPAPAAAPKAEEKKPAAPAKKSAGGY